MIDAEGNEGPGYRLRPEVLQDLPGLFRSLPDNHYAVYVVNTETNTRRLVIEVYVRNGKLIDPGDDSEGTRDRPPTDEQTTEPVEAVPAEAAPVQIAPTASRQRQSCQRLRRRGGSRAGRHWRWAWRPAAQRKPGQTAWITRWRRPPPSNGQTAGSQPSQAKKTVIFCRPWRGQIQSRDCLLADSGTVKSPPVRTKASRRQPSFDTHRCEPALLATLKPMKKRLPRVAASECGAALHRVPQRRLHDASQKPGNANEPVDLDTIGKMKSIDIDVVEESFGGATNLNPDTIQTVDSFSLPRESGEFSVQDDPPLLKPKTTPMVAEQTVQFVSSVEEAILAESMVTANWKENVVGDGDKPGKTIERGKTVSSTLVSRSSLVVKSRQFRHRILRRRRRSRQRMHLITNYWT